MNTYSFENEIDSNFYYSNSSIHLSDKHYKDGKKSLCWNIEGKSQLGLKALIDYKPFTQGSANQARDSFVVWLYLEEALPNKSLRFEFLKDKEICAHFDFNLNFTGWRTAWVPYEIMEGNAVEKMDEVVIKADLDKPCSIYIDQMILCVPIDPRHPTRDKQVPFVNKASDNAVNSHWLALYRFDSLKEEALSKGNNHEVAEKDIKSICDKFEKFLLSYSTYNKKEDLVITDEKMGDIKSFYDEFNIKIDGDHIVGTTIDAACQKVVYPEENKEELMELSSSIDIKKCSSWLIDASYAWHAANPSQKKIIQNMFVNVFRHLLDQGWAHGSSLGTTHHLGYPMRHFYSAIFLMREPLREAGYIKEAADTMSWFSGMGRIFRDDEEFVGESMDTLNTLIQGILASIMLMDNKKDMHVCLKAMQNWLSLCMLPAPGLRGPFKVDGSVFHHCNHYPAYAMGGFTGATPVIYFLSQTEYEVSKEAHSTMRKSLLYMRLFCNHYNWLVSMSARHPKGMGEMSQISTLEPFYYMALAGTPGNTKEIDKEMAEALIRLAKYTDYPKVEELINKGYKAEEDPNGHFTMNYACATLHRRDHWLAGVRGHSRYLWGNETYMHNNLYGRYIGYGTLQILSGGKPVNNKDSGYYQEGWDWNCWPGSTAIHLPFEKLKSDVRNVDDFSGFEEMLVSDETFAGGTSLDKENGMFAMKLHEHAKYDGSHRARKSYYFFDNRIVCLGTGIENTNKEYETRTTLFQNYLNNELDPIYINNDTPVKGLDTEFTSNKEAMYIYDNVGNSYYIPEGQDVKVTRMMQESRAQDTGATTFAPFAKAWIDHGTNPSDKGYEYMIVVNEKADNKYLDEKPYEVLQQDNNAHILLDKANNTICYALFEKPEAISYGNLISTQRPALVMEKEMDNKLSLSICDPDLRLYEGIEEDQYNPDGTQKEISVYSRSWRTSPSKGEYLSVTLKGKWEIENNKDINISYENGNTILNVYCIDAMPVEVQLTSIK